MTEQLYIIFIATLPIVELRGAIPYAVSVFDLPIVQAFVLAVIGNIIPPLLLIPFFGAVNEFLSQRSTPWRNFSQRYLDKLRNNHQARFEALKGLALFLFVAVPFPLSGAWSASLAAHIFGITFKRAIPIIFLGILVAGVIVSLITVGAVSIFS